jgi:4-hydroxybenzoate polyprenyltransferase
VADTIRGLIRATHPLPAAAVTAITAGLAVLLGAPPTAVWWVVAATAAGQASVGWSNDLLDRVRDAAAGRTEKPLVAGRVGVRLVRVLALVTGPASVALALPLGWGPALIMAVAVASAWAYNLGVKATVFSWAPYAASFGLLPVFAWRVAGRVAPWWVVAGAATLGVAAHLMNVLPDLDRDRGMRGLPHRLGARWSVALAAILLGAALVAALALGGAWRRPAGAAAGVAGAALSVAAVAVAGKRPRLAFALTIGAAGAVATVVGLAAP